MAQRVILFDCDGVLVDSEPIALAVLLEAIAEAGGVLDADLPYAKLLGKSLEEEAVILRQEFGVDIALATLQGFQPWLLQRLERELWPIPGAGEALDRLLEPRCVVSSSPLERIRLSLSVTGLLEAFEPHIFSADAVARGKPEPDLFLHAAEVMGARAGDCVVVEDSPAGILAARKAGMRVFAFLGGSHAGPADLHRTLRSQDPDVLFSDMRQLPELIAALDDPIAVGLGHN
jgi:HAD superfamily hydrolase (TIGR01509 family)